MKTTLTSRLQVRYANWQNRQRIARLARDVARHAPQNPVHPPLVLFNASTRITGLSLNAAFQLLTGWSLRLAGVPVVQFVCQAGMSRCVLGLDRSDFTQPPPCAACVAQSHRLYAGAQVNGFAYQPDARLASALHGLGLDELAGFEYPFQLGDRQVMMPLGKMVLPSVRWTLRRHNLSEDENQPRLSPALLLREYILSAHSVALRFARQLEETAPAAALIFNGMMFPEAAARWVARQVGVRSVAHEVGFQRFSTFFTDGEPTAYPIAIPDDFHLTPEQDARLDAYLENRFQGRFSMAGIQFWPEMRGLDQAFLERAARFRQVVPVFTNVIYDTSQVHANVLYPHMFAWLDDIAALVRAHPDTLFVIRAHPDEMRPGTAKQSNESVHDWVHANGVAGLPNAVFIDSQEYISSYELIQRSRFVIVYNSSIGLEAALMGAPVLCGGKARYTQYPTVFMPDSADGFRRMAGEFLDAAQIEVPSEFRTNARRFLYYQLYRTSLPMDEYLQTGPRPGFVLLRDFGWQRLLPENAPGLGAIHAGLLEGKPFLVEG